MAEVLPLNTVMNTATPTRVAQTIAGFTNSDIAQRQARMRQLVDKERPRLEKIFGPIDPWDVRKFLRVEQEREQCRDCHGLPCKKVDGMPEQFPSIYRSPENHRSIGYKPCRYKIAADFQNSLARRLHSSKIPERYVGKTFDDYEVDDLNRDAVNYAKSVLSTGRGAFLFGQRGTGKTFLAAIIAQEFLKAGKSVIFEKVPMLLSDIRDTFNGNGTLTEAQILDAATTVDLLVLDDFGMEKPKRFVGATLCNIIDARYDNPRLTTIITSNNSLEQIRTTLDDAVDGKNYNGSRIHDRCVEICKPILLRGSSRRN